MNAISVGETIYLATDQGLFENTGSTLKPVAALNDALGERGAMISNGYGDLKDKCFRIAHMGDLTLDDMKWLLAQIEDILGL